MSDLKINQNYKILLSYRLVDIQPEILIEFYALTLREKDSERDYLTIYNLLI